VERYAADVWLLMIIATIGPGNAGNPASLGGLIKVRNIRQAAPAGTSHDA
jgi:hypothetical protein